MNNMQQFAQKDTFAQHLGIELLEASEGHAKTQLKITEKHLNGLKMVHGGVIFALADFTFAVASNSRDRIAVAINANISYVKAAYEGIVLQAEAKETSLTPKLATYAVHVSNDEGETIAIFQGMAYRKNTN